MKFFKTLEILSDGSCIFSYKSTIATKNRLITLLKNDNKNFYLNQKKIKSSIDSANSSLYKKRYFK